MVSVRASLIGLLFGGVLSASFVTAQQAEDPNRSSNSFVSQTGGLLGRLSSRGKTTPEPEPPKASSASASVKPAGGILGRIFGSGGDSAPKPSGGGKDDDGRRVIEPVPHTDTPDWDGVPFHKASPLAARGSTAPLNDPKDPSNRGLGSLREIANSGGYQSGREVNGKDVAAKSASSSATTNIPTEKLGSGPSTSRVPVPPAEKTIAAKPKTVSTDSASPRVASVETAKPQLKTSTYQPPSATESSRRSRRKAVDPLEIALDRHRGAAEETQSGEGTNEALANGVPSVPRQSIRTEVADPIPATKEPDLGPPPAPTWVPARDVAAAEPNAGAPEVESSDSVARSDAGQATLPERMASSPATTLAAPTARRPSTGSSDEVASVDSVIVPSVPSTPIVNPSASTGNVAANESLPAVPSLGTPAMTASVPTNQVPAAGSSYPQPAASSSTASVPATSVPAPSIPATGVPGVNTDSSPARAMAPAPTASPNSTLAGTGTANVSPDNFAGTPSVPSLPVNSLGANQAPSVAGNSIPPVGPTPEASTSNSTLDARDTNAAKSQVAPSQMASNPGAVGPSTVDPNAVGGGDTVMLTSDLPGLRVTTVGPTDVTIRKPINYKIMVENRGAIDAPGAAIQVKLPPWVELTTIAPSRGEIVRQNDPEEQQLLWVVEGLPRSGQENLQIQLIAKESREFNVDVEWAVVPQSSIARVAVREPKLELVIEGPESVVFGQSANYRVRVMNPGNGVAENVVFTLSPNSATPQSQRIGRILPGEETKFDVELTARDLESLQIHGLATAELDMKVEQVKKIQVTSAQLTAVLSGPALKYQDSVGNFKIEVANQGTADATDVEAVLELPAGISYQGGIDNARQEGQLLRWKIAKLGIGEKVEYPLQCVMQKTGLHTLTFSCQGMAAANANVQFQTQVDALADLVLTINDPQAPAPTQQEVTYEIVIRNRGSKAATEVVALAQFGFDIEPIRVEGADATVEPGQVLFNPIDKIEPGQTVTLRVIAKAEKPGLHRFRSEVRCSDTLLIAEEATRYLEAVGQRVSRSSSSVENR